MGVTAPTCAEDLLSLAAALNEGRGTAYERYALDRFWERQLVKLRPGNVLELPANGVMGTPGIKSLILAARGVEVTLGVPDGMVAEEIRQLWQAVGLRARVVVTGYEASEFAAGAFDMVWNFCVLEHVPDIDALLGEMLRVSRRHVLVLTQNPYNPGIPLHRLYHRVRGEPWDHGELSHIAPARVVERLRRLGAQVVATGGLDLPPWPDINMQLGPPKDAAPERYPDAYAHLRPGVLRRPTDQIVKRIAGRAVKPDLWAALYRGWNRVESLLPAEVLKYTAHHPWVLARVDR